MKTDFRRSELVAFALSLFPGGGQFYNGHMWKGVLILCTFWMVGIPWLIGIIEAPIAARRINQGKVNYKLRPIWLRLFIYGFFMMFYAAIIIPSAFRSKSEVCRYYAYRTLQSLEKAAYKYNESTGEFPLNEQMLYSSNVFLAEEKICEKVYQDITFSCDLSRESFLFRASHENFSGEGTVSYSLGMDGEIKLDYNK
ncbi:TM2 domain-containing protein [Candidatus Pacearchaeota archaeon]|nr:TM2 domain-containing protein [Candidatus Pacearchaeota archaeon]